MSYIGAAILHPLIGQLKVKSCSQVMKINLLKTSRVMGSHNNIQLQLRKGNKNDMTTPTPPKNGSDVEPRMHRKKIVCIMHFIRHDVHSYKCVCNYGGNVKCTYCVSHVNVSCLGSHGEWNIVVYRTINLDIRRVVILAFNP